MQEWILEYDLSNNNFYTAKVIQNTCPLCSKTSTKIIHFHKQPIPKSYINSTAIIIVQASAYKSLSGLSYTHIPDVDENNPCNHGKSFILASQYRHLKIIRLPKHSNLIDTSSLPSNSIIYCWNNLTIIFTNHPISYTSFFHQKNEICHKCCSELILNSSEKIEQGHLVLAPMNSSLTEIKEKILNYGHYSHSFFNHHLQNKQFVVFKNFCCIISDSISINIESNEHETIQIPQGIWIGYHPNPDD